MRILTMAILVSSATAGAQSIFPAGGPVGQSPTLWISSPHMPSVEVTNAGGPVMYELDESQMDQLHPSTLTALLPVEQPEIHYAHPAMELSPREMALRAGGTRVAANPAGARAQ